MHLSDCVFCTFKEDAVVIYQDRQCFAIISKNPINQHHILLIPRAHYVNFVEIPDALVSHLFIVAKKLSKALRLACKPDAITHLFDDDLGDHRYNVVAHYKIHLIPRFKQDLGIIDWGKMRKEASAELRSEYAHAIKKHLA